MKKKVFVIIAVLMFMNIYLICQETKTFKNAYDWGQFNWASKVYFLDGLYQGSMATFAVIVQTLKDKHQWQIEKITDIINTTIDQPYYINLANATVGQIVDGIDELYKDYANKNIPIFAIATLVTKRIAGKIKTEDVEKELQKLRTVEWK